VARSACTERCRTRSAGASTSTSTSQPPRPALRRSSTSPSSSGSTLSGIENAFEEDGSIEIIARHQDDSIRLDVTGSAGQLDGSVFVNGALFATVTGDASNPTIASATGDPLTLGEWLVLRHIVDGAEDVFDFIEDLVDPVDELVLLAIIL
jgi:hypothetical protein